MDTLPIRTLYYGRDGPLPEKREFRAGPLTLLFEDGDLRYVRLGDHEVLRRVYVSVRDSNWDTVLPVISNLYAETGAGWFRISFDAEHRRDEIDFAWKGTVTGDAQGTVTFAMDGRARSTFRRSRIGFSLIRQKACTGAPRRSTPKAGNACASRPSSKAATANSSAAVTEPCPPLP